MCAVLADRESLTYLVTAHSPLTMPVPGKSSEDAELKDLTKLLQSYRDKDGSINPDRAPPDMKVLQ